MLSRGDIAREGSRFVYEEKKEAGVRVIHTPLFTSGIGYLRILFDAMAVPQEDLPYVGLLKSILGYVNTEEHTYQDLSSEIYLNSGGIDFSVVSYPGRDGAFQGFFCAKAKVLYARLPFAFSVIGEILTKSQLDDEKRLGEILDETCSRARMKMENGFHGAAVGRASSYFDAASAFDDSVGGIGYYQFLENAARRYGKEPEYRKKLADKLKKYGGAAVCRGQFPGELYRRCGRVWVSARGAGRL